MKCQAVLATLALCLAVAAATVFKDCGSKTGVITSVDVTPCDANPCILHAGKNVTVSIKFKPNAAVAKGTAVVHGVILGIPAPFPLPDADLCKFVSPGCPLQAGSEYTYTNQLFVKSIYPHISLTVKWELVDDTNKDIACMLTPVAIAA